MAQCNEATTPLRDRSPVPRTRSVQRFTSRQRAQAIRTEQLQAAQTRLATEVSRPKLLIQDSDVLKPRRPRFYIELAKLKAQNRTQSSESPAPGQLSTRSVSQLTSHKAQISNAIVLAEPSPRPSVPLLRKAKEASVLPGWVTERQDFAGAYVRLRESCYQDVVATCRKSALFRTDEEKNGLRKWVQMVPELAQIKPAVMEEAMNRLHTVDFPERTKGVVTIYPDSGPIRLENNGFLGADILQPVQSSPLCITETPCSFIRLTKFDYEQSVLQAAKLAQVVTLQMLLSAPFFASLTEVKLRRISACLEKVKCSTGETVYKSGDQAYEMYVVRDGEVALQYPVSVNQNNRWPVGRQSWEVDQIRLKYNLQMRKCRRGDSFGVRGMREGSVRTMTAVALQECVLYRLHFADFQRLFTRKEQEALESMETITIPSKEKLAEQVLQQLKADRLKKDTLFSVVQVDARHLDARESFQTKKTKKLRGWMEDLTERTAQDSKRSRASVTALKHRRVVVGPQGLQDSSSEECDT